jgi:hypothetical protein
MKRAYAAAVIGLALMSTGPQAVWAYNNPKSLALTMTISNQLSVGLTLEAGREALGAKVLGAEFTLSNPISVDNDSSADSTGYVETYQLSASNDKWNLSTDGVVSAANEMVLMAVFSAAAADTAPDSTEFGSGDIITSGGATTASDTIYYGVDADSAKNGVSVAPAANHERTLWLRFLLPAVSDVITGNVTTTLYVNAIAG